MQMKLYYSTKNEVLELPANEGFGEVLELLKKLEDRGIKCDKIDTSQLKDEEVFEAYIRSVTPTQLKKYKVRQVFGSARHSGWLFGKQVPALVVYGSSSQVPEDVFPHAIGTSIVTIKQYLKKLASE